MIKELPEPLNSSHSRYKTTDPNGNHGHVTSGQDHVTTTNISSENQEPISISLPVPSPQPATSNGEHETANSSTETPPQSLPPTITTTTTEEGQSDIPDDQNPNDSETMPMETSETHPETTTTPPHTTEPTVSHVTDVTMEDIEPGTTTPARTPENAVAVEQDALEVEGQEEMEVSISCTQEDSRPVSEAVPEENSTTEDSKSEDKKSSVEMAATSSVATGFGPGNLRNE